LFWMKKILPWGALMYFVYSSILNIFML